MDEGDIIDGRYKVQNKLGQGGMGQVFKGHDCELNKTVAIKVLFPNTPDQVIKRFHTEAKALAKLDHPNIMQVLHFGQASNGQLYLINEFVKGDSLSSMIESRGPQTFFDVLPIFEKICRGLRYAHMEKVLHRDIKPSNVMLSSDRTKEDSVKLVDFGLAKPNDQSHELTKTGTAMGSPPYMSPEAVHGKETDERSDIYSLGCTFFEMMAAVPPFVGETPFHTMMAQINRLPPSLHEACEKQFDEEVEAYVQKFLRKNPADRFQNMDEVIAELERVKNALIEKKRASEGLLASGVYASGAWIAEKTKNMNVALKIGAIVAFVAILITVPLVYMKYAYVGAPKASIDGDSSQAARPVEARTEENEKKFDDSTSGFVHRDAGAQVIQDKGSGYQACLLTGALERAKVQEIMEKHKDMKCFQFEEATLEPSSIRFVLQFPIEKVNFVNMKVTDTMLEAVGKMKQLKHLRITDCGELPAGSLDLLKPLKSNGALMTIDLACGRTYKQPIVPFTNMPMLVNVKFESSTITREDLKALTSLKNIQELQLKDCSIAPDAIPVLKGTPTCTKLSITETELTPQQFQQIGDLHFLRLLQMNDTNIDNAALSKFVRLKNLIFLDVKNTNVDAVGMKNLMTAIPSLTPAGAQFGRKRHDDIL